MNAQQDGYGIWAAGGGGAGGSGGSSGDGARPRRPAIDAQAAATMRALCDLAFPHAAPHTHRTNEELLAMCAAWAVSDGGEGSGGSPVPVHRPKEVQRGRLLPTYTKKQKKQKRRMLAGDPVFEVCTYAARASEDMPRRALSVLLLPRTVILPSLTNTVND